MGSKLKHLFRSICWGFLTGAAAAIALGMEAPPAAAAELNDWSYDSQTRSITLTVPSNVLPSVSVISPDQLLIELPDTQVGGLPRMTVADGVVDSIELEQISSETLWMVVELAEGTELLGEQTAVPVEQVAGGQRWEVRPNAIASDEPAANIVTNGGADILRVPEADVAQADFPDLPILEPGIQLDQPVSVPPIGTSPNVTAPPPPPPPPAASSPVVSVPPMPEETSGQVAADADIPSEPPFLGEETFEVPVVDGTTLLEGELAEEDAIAEDPVEEDESVAAEVFEEVPAAEADEVLVEVVADAEAPTVEADFVPGDAVATASELRTRVDASFVSEPVPFGEDLGTVEADSVGQEVVPQSTDRWPEPIPFGAPLP